MSSIVSIHFTCELKVFTTKKPDNPTVLLALPVEHECVIGAFLHVAVGAVICGDVRIGDNTFVGAGATVIQGIHIRENRVIGAGSLVLRDVPSQRMIYGQGGEVNSSSVILLPLRLCAGKRLHGIAKTVA